MSDTAELAACLECETRGYVYQFSCARCIARMIARTPQKFASAWFESWKETLESVEEVETMRKAVAAERELDQGLV